MFSLIYTKSSITILDYFYNLVNIKTLLIERRQENKKEDESNKLSIKLGTYRDINNPAHCLRPYQATQSQHCHKRLF